MDNGGPSRPPVDGHRTTILSPRRWRVVRVVARSIRPVGRDGSIKGRHRRHAVAEGVTAVCWSHIVSQQLMSLIVMMNTMARGELR